MKPILAGIVLAVLSIVVPATAAAQAYPTKPIRVIAPFPAGGTSDTIARILGQKLTEAWKQQAIVENRAGVAGSLGSSVAAKSPPDGYTLLVGNVGPVAINHNVYKNVGYDPVKDFTPITLAVTAPQIVVVHPSVPAKTFKDFTGLVRKHRGKINYGSSGPGSISHLSAELYKQMTGTDMLHVPYKGTGPALTDLLGGQVTMTFTDVMTALPHIRTGKLKAIGVTSAKRSRVLPDVPTLAEQGLTGYDSSVFFGVVAPAGTPEPVIARLNEGYRAALVDPKVKELLDTQGLEPPESQTPEALGEFMKSEVAKWAEVVKASGAQVD